MWRKGNPPTLLVGMLIGATTMENSMQITQKTKNGVAILSSNPATGHTPGKTIIQKHTCTFMFTAALFTIAKTQK